MPSFRLLVVRNEVVAYNHKLSCEASTMAELERVVAAKIGVDFPVWIFMRDADFGNEFWRVTDLADLHRYAILHRMLRYVPQPHHASAHQQNEGLLAQRAVRGMR